MLPRVSRCSPTSYTRCRPTHPIRVQCWASVAAHCWLYVDKSSTTLAKHYSNTGSALYLAAAPQQTRAIHPILFQCSPNVFDALSVWWDCRIAMRRIQGSHSKLKTTFHDFSMIFSMIPGYFSRLLNSVLAASVICLNCYYSLKLFLRQKI